jgi:hypothetical protein
MNAMVEGRATEHTAVSLKALLSIRLNCDPFSKEIDDRVRQRQKHSAATISTLFGIAIEVSDEHDMNAPDSIRFSCESHSNKTNRSD